MSWSSSIHCHGFNLCHGVHCFIVMDSFYVMEFILIYCHMDSFYVMEFIDSLSWIHSMSWSSLIHFHGFIQCHGDH